MAVKYFKGGATVTSQVDTFTPGGTITTGDVDRLTYTAEDGTTTAITFTVGGTTTATAVSAGLIAAWNANAKTAAAATATGTSTVILTAFPGIPFSVASSVTGVGTLTRAATTPNAGPKAWGTAANWSDAAVPANGDTVITDGRMANEILYDLDQSAVTLAEFDDYRSRRFAVGTGTAALKIGATVAQISTPTTDGTAGTGAFININFGTVVGEFTVHGSAAAGLGGLAPVTLTANNASNVLNVMGGTVWVGRFVPGAANAFATINAVAGTLTLGTGVTFTTLNNEGATVTVEKVATGMTVTSEAGKTTLLGDAKVGTVNANGGTVIASNRTSGDDIGTLNMNGGTIDFTMKPTAFTCNALVVHLGGTINLFNSAQGTWTGTTWDSSDGIKLAVNVKA